MTGTGRCLCGLVRYAVDGPMLWRAHCHCESCRRATASPFTTFFGVAVGAFRWTGEEPARFQSSPGVWRRFCLRCGTPMAYHGATRTEEIDLYAATLDDHAAFRAEQHVHWAERVAWVELSDGLPRR